MLLDIGVGILTAIGVSEFFSVPLTVSLLFAGIAFALLPDIDFLYHLGTGGSTHNVYRHRELLHYPLLFVPPGAFAAHMIGGAPWAVLFAVTVLAHFVHDSVGIGWGVRWFWPLSRDRYSFLYLYQPRHKKPLPRRLLYVWKDADMAILEERHGDTDWLKNVYGSWHPYAIVELAVFLVAVAILMRVWL
ncbi:metal-dependent hydrolase [Candidatus Parcubacteria bacterium]|nr:MAG: metal-dependent hydrolase [Candidatus Parcubacteria bacterium]